MTAERPPAPYPADTRAKGWRFELDYERIDQSDTWDIAAEVPIAQPALLMMWLVAWRQEPCGALPNDAGVIRAKCRIPAATWAKVGSILMRGWWVADDGRMYHKTVTVRVLEMLEYRAATAKRVAKHKEAKRLERAGNALPERESTDSNDTGTGTGTGTKEQQQDPPPATQSVPPAVAGCDPVPPAVEKPPKVEPWLTVADMAADGIGAEVALAWLAHRRARKAKLTALAWAGFKREAAKAGWPNEQAVLKAIARNWTGFEAAWVAADGGAGAGGGETAYQRSMRERIEEVSPALARKVPGAATQPLQEVFDVAAKRIA